MHYRTVISIFKENLSPNRDFFSPKPKMAEYGF